jgi:hypothetical protein
MAFLRGLSSLIKKGIIKRLGDTTYQNEGPTSSQGIGGFFGSLFSQIPTSNNSGIARLLPQVGQQLDSQIQAQVPAPGSVPAAVPTIAELAAANQLPPAGQLALAGLSVPQALAGLTPEQIEELKTKGTLNGMPTTVGAAFQQATSTNP